MQSASKDQPALYVSSQNVTIWIAPSTFSQFVNTLPSAAQTVCLGVTCISLSKSLTVLYLLNPAIDQARCTSSRPGAILVIPCPANPNRPPTPPSHRVLRSMRRIEGERTSAT
eukprot:812181-Pelagomonas_calceolata.AAC.1